MKPERGRFIVLEGGEGAGKSTQAQVIADWLRARGREVMQTREPGGTSTAEAIRALILADRTPALPPLAELLLMFAARLSHVEEKIRPALARGADVVCDRFVDASYAYQGAGRGLPLAAIRALERMTLRGLKPDLVLLFDIEPEAGLARARSRGDANRFEAEALAFQKRVRAAYRTRARGAPKRYVRIDAGRSQGEVSAAVLRVLEKKL